MSLMNLLNDAKDLLRLNFKENVADYRYSPVVSGAVLLGLGVLGTAQNPYLDMNAVVIVFMVLFSALRWVLLAYFVPKALQFMRPYPSANFVGFVLASEALALPVLFFIPLMPYVSLAISLWLIWTFWVQLSGFAHYTKQGKFAVFSAYVCCVIVLVLGASVLMYLFHLLGWFDLEALSERWSQLPFFKDW